MNGSKFKFRLSRFGAAVNYALSLCVATFLPTSAALAENQVAPLNYFLHSYGPASTPTMFLGWVFASLLVAIFVIVALLLLRAIFRKRSVEDPVRIGREYDGTLWIYIGTGLSASILFALAIYTLITLNAIAKPAHAPALALTVTGYDWWWNVEYEDDDPTRSIVTANEIHIPVGQPVLVKLKSADVIHAQRILASPCQSRYEASAFGAGPNSAMRSSFVEWQGIHPDCVGSDQPF